MKAWRKVRNYFVQQPPPLFLMLAGPAGTDRQQQRAPGLEAPGQGGHRHIREIGDQGIDRGVQGPHPTFELGDKVLLVATGERALGHHLIRTELPVVAM